MKCVRGSGSRIDFMSVVVLLALSSFSCACSARTWNAVAQLAAMAPASNVAQPANSAVSGNGTTKVMIFGGQDHKVYLGCLNCSEYAVDSVRNQYGLHGSLYAVDSIFNTYGQYGSPYAMYSACNPYATDPPVIVDQDGAFYGRLTVNQYHAQRTRNETLIQWLQTVCNK